MALLCALGKRNNTCRIDIPHLNFLSGEFILSESYFLSAACKNQSTFYLEIFFTWTNTLVYFYFFNDIKILKYH